MINAPKTPSEKDPVPQVISL